MKMIEEYGNLTIEDMAKRTILERLNMTNQHEILISYELTHSTEGYELAGSCARWTGEKWGVLYRDHGGTQYGRWYLSEKDAVDDFERRKRQ